MLQICKMCVVNYHRLVYFVAELFSVNVRMLVTYYNIDDIFWSSEVKITGGRKMVNMFNLFLNLEF